ncbi:MAG TPA: hypothetical protein VE869_04540 [Gemmatimonas sp.]|nr:hypothetical protein [Gemmatimonas sp.]
MRHFHRTTLPPSGVLSTADQYFAGIGMARSSGDTRERQFNGPIGALALRIRMEGGHYTLVEAYTDQMGESRLDKNVKNFFATLHRAAEPRHRIEAGF